MDPSGFMGSILTNWLANQLPNIQDIVGHHVSRTEVKTSTGYHYLPVCLIRRSGVISIESSGDIQPVSQEVPIDTWGEKVSAMQSFLSSPDADRVQGMGLALGIQNLITSNGDLFVGVRTKAAEHKFATNSTIARGAFNTGNKLLKVKGDLEAVHRGEFQDLFEMKSAHYTKSFVEPDSVLHKKIAIRAGQNACVFEIAGHRYVGLIFLNKSHFCPRYEIGLCKTVDISGAPPVTTFIDSFGADRFEPENYWIWVSRGRICYWSFSSGRFVPADKTKSAIKNKQGILVSSHFLENNSGIDGTYVPVASDELLERQVILNQQFSAPARSVLECF